MPDSPNVSATVDPHPYPELTPILTKRPPYRYRVFTAGAAEKSYSGSKVVGGTKQRGLSKLLMGEARSYSSCALGEIRRNPLNPRLFFFGRYSPKNENAFY